MSWVRVDDKFKHHPKVLRAGAHAVGFWLIACCWVAEYATDGFIPAHVVPTLFGYLPELVDRLLDSGMWKPAEGGYMVHDFLAYNPSKAQQEARREAWRDKQQARRTKQKRDPDNDVPLRHQADSRESPGMGNGEGDPVLALEIQETDQESPRARKKRTPKAEWPAVPEWVPADRWAAFDRFRRAGKAPWTPDAAEVCLRDLAKLRAEGHDPAAVIDRSIGRGWTGFFPLNGHRDTKPDNGAHRRVADAAAEERRADLARARANRAAPEEAAGLLAAVKEKL